MFFPKLLPLLVISLLSFFANSGCSENTGFAYTDFHTANLTIDGATKITQNGLLRLTNYDSLNQVGHVFYPNPINFKSSLNNSSISSFSTTFVFGMIPKLQGASGGNGMTFVIAPQRGLPYGLPSQYLGLFNISNTKNTSNHVFAVELDTIQNPEFDDIDANHVGIDINDLVSIESQSAGYHPDNDPTSFVNLKMISGNKMQLWVEYDGVEKQINVTLAPFEVPKPSTPLISISYDLSEVVNETAYVGFSAATGTILASYYVVGWSFKMNGKAPALDLSKLAKLPHAEKNPKSKLVSIGLPLLSSISISVVIIGLVYYVVRRFRYAELIEDWEIEYGPHRFKFEDLYKATKGFSEQEVVGSGGFGKVYKGVLLKSMTEIAVKRVYHDARQGMEGFIAEIVSIGRLRHRNLVSLLGYCRRKGELLLVYDYMPYGSLDKFLYNNPKVTLSWTQRFRVIKGVAAGLFYLHEEWEQVVIHRDIKAGNVLIDAELNGRLGDFGLARMYDHGAETRITNIIGTLGYLAPEFLRTGRATRSTDVFAFGTFLLEVTSGRRPVETEGEDPVILVDWVFSSASRGAILEARDPNLGDDFVEEEVELVLRLGLMCSRSDAGSRPTMRQVVQYLEGNASMPGIPPTNGILPSFLLSAPRQRVDDFAMSYQSSMERAFSSSSSVSESYLAIGR